MTNHPSADLPATGSPPAPANALPATPARTGLALLLLAIVLTYANSLRGPFVYDDVESIADNPAIRQLWPPGWLVAPAGQGGLTTAGRPVLALSLALNFAISGQAVWSYHAVNVAIHAGAALLLFGLVRRTLAPRWGTRAAALALIATAAWALHPLQTQAVTYTVQRAEALMGFFFLLTLYAFVRGWLATSLAACALGMATKEVMATAPLIILLYDRTFLAGTFGEAWRRRGRFYLTLAATWLVLAALVVSTGGNRGGTVGLGVGVPLWAYPLTQFEAVQRYLALSLWPQPLVFEYGTRWVRTIGDTLPGAAVVMPLLGLTGFALWRWPIAGFCGAAFFAILAPSSLAPGTLQMIVEHRMYLPLGAVAAAGAVGAHRLLGRRIWLPAAAVAIALGALTAQRNHTYRSALALWADTVAKRPDNPRARDGLAAALAAAGRLEEAIAQGREVIRLQPDDAKYRYNLALHLATAGRPAEALPHYEAARRLNPNDPRIRNNLAVTLVSLGRIEEALPHYEAAARLQPDAQFHYNHAIALTRLQRSAAAIVHYEHALRLQPGYADAHLNLGSALMAGGRHEEAITHYREAVRLAPQDPALRTTLGGALLVTGRAAEAGSEFRAALAAAPDSAEACYGLGNVARAQGRAAEAVTHYEAALRLKPDFANAHFKLGNVLLDLDRVINALAHYEAAVRLMPDDAEVQHNLGIAYARLDRFAEARRALEAALRIRPDYADAQRHLAQVRAVLGR